MNKLHHPSIVSCIMQATRIRGNGILFNMQCQVLKG